MVVFADMNAETAKASAEESRQYATSKEYQAIYFKVNVVDEKGVQDMVDFVVKEFGRIDYCVNGAGVSDCPGLLTLAFIRNRQAYLSFSVDLMNALGGGWAA